MGPIPFSSCERFLLCSPPFFRHVFFSIPVIIVENTSIRQAGCTIPLLTHLPHHHLPDLVHHDPSSRPW